MVLPSLGCDSVKYSVYLECPGGFRVRCQFPDKFKLPGCLCITVDVIALAYSAGVLIGASAEVRVTWCHGSLLLFMVPGSSNPGTYRIARDIYIVKRFMRIV